MPLVPIVPKFWSEIVSRWFLHLYIKIYIYNKIFHYFVIFNFYWISERLVCTSLSGITFSAFEIFLPLFIKDVKRPGSDVLVINMPVLQVLMYLGESANICKPRVKYKTFKNWLHFWIFSVYEMSGVQNDTRSWLTHKEVYDTCITSTDIKNIQLCKNC